MLAIVLVGCAEFLPPELCNGLDDDGNGTIDDPGALGSQAWHFDGDGDGYGDPELVELRCHPPSEPGWVQDYSDCDDADPQRFPGAPERCDGVDDDCDGDVTDEQADVDGDGYPVCGGDCEDGDARVHPEQLDVCNGVDDDCDGVPDQHHDAWEPNDTARQAPTVAGDDEYREVKGYFTSELDGADVFRVDTVNDSEFLTNSFYVAAELIEAPVDLQLELVLRYGLEEVDADRDPTDGLFVGWDAASFGWGGGGTFLVEVVHVAGTTCDEPYLLAIANGG